MLPSYRVGAAFSFEALGSVLICTVMLADRFLFTLQDGFVLTTAIISAVLLTIGIRACQAARRRKSELILRAFLIPKPPDFTPSFEKACAGRPFCFPHFDLYIISVEALGYSPGAYFCQKGGKRKCSTIKIPDARRDG